MFLRASAAATRTSGTGSRSMVRQRRPRTGLPFSPSSPSVWAARSRSVGRLEPRARALDLRVALSSGEVSSGTTRDTSGKSSFFSTFCFFVSLLVSWAFAELKTTKASSVNAQKGVVFSTVKGQERHFVQRPTQSSGADTAMPQGRHEKRIMDLLLIERHCTLVSVFKLFYYHLPKSPCPAWLFFKTPDAVGAAAARKRWRRAGPLGAWFGGKGALAVPQLPTAGQQTCQRERCVTQQHAIQWQARPRERSGMTEDVRQRDPDHGQR